MINKSNIELKNVGPIANAKININKINIVGGKNSTGKSTASKLLYCFLKVNSANREKLIAPVILERLDKFNLSLRYSNNQNYGSFDDLIFQSRILRKTIRNGLYDNFEDLFDSFDEIEILFNEILEEIENSTKGLYQEYIKSIKEGNNLLIEDFNNVKRVFNSAKEGSDEFFEETMKDLLFSELEIEFPSEFDFAKFYHSVNPKFSFNIKFNDSKFECEGKFNVSNVFYLESFSVFDNYLSNDLDSEHVSDLKEHLFPKKRPSKAYEDKSIKKLEEIITNIVGGRIIKKESDLKFVSKNSSYASSMKNTASGIKQIAVIQTLLHNRFLNDNSVLIMDEPEVNLHPEWQIKLARILVLLAKEGNIILYINSHSPMFIEAMDTFAEYYDFGEYVSYYLSEQSGDDKNRFDFNKVPSDELYLIYDNLGDPYDYLDRVRLSKGRGEDIDDLDF